MNTTPCVVASLLLTLFVLSVMCWFASPAPVRRRRCARAAPNPQQRCDPFQEPFEELDTGTPDAPPALREVLDFSEVLVTDEERRDTDATNDDIDQIQTIDNRFKSAKRKLTEDRLETGVHNTAKRRKILEQLLRRPHCTRRVRAWRTENSDYLRGDVRPKGQSSSSNLIRSAKNNPDIDLHPGALGPVAGMNGLWLSHENMPDNMVPDAYVQG